MTYYHVFSTLSSNLEKPLKSGNDDPILTNPGVPIVKLSMFCISLYIMTYIDIFPIHVFPNVAPVQYNII